MNLDHRLQDDSTESQKLQEFTPLGEERRRRRKKKIKDSEPHDLQVFLKDGLRL